jgi:hypothetical protein
MGGPPALFTVTFVLWAGMAQAPAARTFSPRCGNTSAVRDTRRRWAYLKADSISRKAAPAKETRNSGALMAGLPFGGSRSSGRRAGCAPGCPRTCDPTSAGRLRPAEYRREPGRRGGNGVKDLPSHWYSSSIGRAVWFWRAFFIRYAHRAAGRLKAAGPLAPASWDLRPTYSRPRALLLGVGVIGTVYGATWPQTVTRFRCSRTVCGSARHQPTTAARHLRELLAATT